jgi:large subunit ribosomal protein L1
MATPFRAFPVTARNISASCRSTLRQNGAIAPFLYPLSQQQVRGVTNNPQAKGKKDQKGAKKKNNKGARDYVQKDLKLIDQYALCDAMRCDSLPHRKTTHVFLTAY